MGRGKYVLALSADHGVATVPEVAAAAGHAAGRVRSTMDAALTDVGPGARVARVEYTEVYLTEAARTQMTATRIAPALAALRAIVPAPNWILVPDNDSAGGTSTTHGSLHAYDQHVPLVFLGTPFAPGRYQAAATPADAAPTLAATVGLAFTGVEGRALTASAPPVAPPR